MTRLRFKTLMSAVVLAAAAACDSTLTVQPTDEVESDRAIVNANTARAALAGAYDALQSGSYYGLTILVFGDLPSNDVEHSGTFTSYADMNRHVNTADAGDFESAWDALYRAIDRSNQLIARLPAITDLTASEKNQILGEAYFLRALAYHNLVKFWGGVPIRTTPATSIEEASQISRSTVDQVYAQILSDLDQAEQLIETARQTRKASDGAVRALRSRVLLYRQNWAGAEAAATATMAMGYALAPTFASLFTPDGDDTSEDIFRVAFTAQESNSIGYYYQSSGNGGRREVAPTAALNAAFPTGDVRRPLTIGTLSRSRLFGTKYPTAEGAEDIHVIRLAEVILNRAEARAQLGNLAGAVADYNLIRVRAGLAPHVLGTHVTTQAQVLAEIYLQRRLELALEGHRWPDLVRTGQATTVEGIPAFRMLFPIPQNELDVAPNLVQNPGY